MNGLPTRLTTLSARLGRWSIAGVTALALIAAASAQGIGPGERGAPLVGDVSDFSKLPRLEPGQSAPAERSRPARGQARKSKQPLPHQPAPTTPPVRPVRRVFGDAMSTTNMSPAGGAQFFPASLPPSPPPSASFQGILDNATRFNPDTQGGVGTNHIMTMTSSEVQVLDRMGSQISRVSLSNFWANIGTNASTRAFDPRLQYEPFGQRWIATAMANPGDSNAALLVAVSQSSNPTGLWNRYFLAVNQARDVYADSPNLGFSRDCIVVQANMFVRTNDDHASFDVWVFNKASLYAGAASPSFTRFSLSAGFTTNDFGAPENAMVPAVTYDNTVTTNYLVANWDGNDPVDGGSLRVYYIATNSNTGLLEMTPGNLSFEFPFGGSPPWDSFPPHDSNFAPQSGTTNKIYMGDSRILSCVFRNETLWVAHTVFLPANGPANHCAVQWWELTPGGIADDGVTLTGDTVIQRGRIEDPSGARFYAYPSIAVSRRNDVVVGYSRFAANQFPSANYAFRIDSDVFSSLRADTVLKSGEARFFVDDLGYNHWGDWSATVVDPNNDTDIWTLQEYASAPVDSIDRWGTWWGRVSPPADLSVAMTGMPSPVIAGSNITYSITILTTNNKIQTVSGVRLVDTLPAGAVLVSATPSQGACVQTNGVVTCDFGTVGDTGRVTATFVVTLNNSGTAKNIATVSSYGPELTSADNTLTLSTTVSSAADLEVLVSDAPDPVTVSNVLTYSITVTNRGPSAALSVVLTNTLPPNMTYISSTPSQGSCARSLNIVNCSLGTIATQAIATVQIQIVPTSPGNLTCRATVVTAAIDPVPANNTNVVITFANASPTLGLISDRTINEDSALSAVAFQVGDFETAASSLVLTGFCSNPAIVPGGNIVFGGSGSNRNVSITPAPNANGVVTITRMVFDALGASATNSFLLTILPVNDAPSINNILDFTIDEDSSTNITITVNDPETPATSLTVSAASSFPAVVPNANLVLSGTGPTRTLGITPATNQFGTTTITVTVSDGTNTTSDTFLLTVRPVNDPPAVSSIGSRVVNEDTSTGPIPFTVADFETSGSNLVITAFSSNTSLVPNANITLAIVSAGTNRTISVLPGTNQFGTVNITLRVADADGGVVSNSFQLTINPVNDPPTFNPISDLTTNEDAGLVTITLAGISPGATNEIQDLLMTATSGNTALIPSVTVNYTPGNPAGSLSFTPVANSNGVSTITVTALDGGASNSVTVRSFNVTITAVNDPPVISDITNRSINEDTTTGAINFTIGDVDNAATGLSLMGSSSDQGIVPNGNIVFSGTGSNRTVVVTPAPNAYGLCTITVSVSDGLATNSDSFLLTVISLNDPPTLSSITDRTINEDSPIAFNFTVGDLETPPGSLTVAVNSSNQGLVPNLNLQVTGDTAARTLTITPAAHQFGTATITLTVTDLDGGTNATSFLLTVNAVNDPPTLAPIPDVTINESDPPQQIVLTGVSGGPANEPQAVTFTAVSGAPSIIPNPTVSYTNGSPAAVLRFTPVPHANGNVPITVTVDDGATSNRTFSRAFVIHVLNVNDLPIVSDITPRTMLEDTTLVVNFTVFDVETPGGNLTYAAISSNSELIDDAGLVFGGSGTNRTLSIRPLTNAFSSGEILIRVTDSDGGVGTTSFEVNVLAVNDPPSVTGLFNRTINEDTSSGAIPFTLDDPDNDLSLVTVTVASSNPALVPAANLTLGGTSRNRTLTALPVTNQVGTTTITVTASDGAAATTNSFVLTVQSVNDLPTISDIADVVIDEDGSSGPIPFTVGDVETAAGALVLSADSSDATLLPTNNVVFGGNGAGRTVTATPVTNRFGTATVTVTVTDTNGGSASDTFRIVVNPVNDPPTITGLGPVSLGRNSSTNLPFTVGDVDNAVSSLVVTPESLDPVLIPSAGLAVVGSGANRTLTITPAPNQFGVTTVRITARDPGGAAVTNTLLVTVIDDYPPTLSDIVDRSAPEDSPVTISFTVGDAETAAANLAVTGVSLNPALIPASALVFGGSGANRTLTVTPLPNQTGSAVLTVTVTDNNGSAASDTFTLTITNLNDPPTMTGLPPLTINEDTTTGPLPFTVGDVETAPGSLTVTVGSSNTGLVPGANVVPGGSSADRTVTVTPLPDQFGSTTITLTVSDGNGGTTNTTFLLTVAPVNDPPTLAAISDRTVAEDALTQTVALTGISAGAGESQTLSIVAASSNPSLIPTPSVFYTNGNSTGVLTFTPTPNATGTATITVTLNDGAGSNNVAMRAFTVTVTPVNDLPTLSAIGAQATSEDTPLTVSFTVGDTETAAMSLTVTATSTNATLLPVTNILINGSGAARSATLIPATNQFGTTLVTLTVNDGVASVSSSFVLTVSTVNDPPTLNPIDNVPFAWNFANTSILFNGVGSGALNENQALTVTAITANQNIVKVQNVQYTSPATNGILNLQHGNTAGAVLITLTVSDGLLTTTQSFMCYVRPNGSTPPTLSALANQTVNEDTPTAAIAFTISDAVTPAASLIVSGKSSNPALVPNGNIVFGGSGTSRTVTVTPAPNQFGTARVTVSVLNGNSGMTATNFLLTVNPVNDAPTISVLADQTINEDATLGPIGFSVGDAESLPGGLTVTASSSNTGLVPNANIVLGGSGTNRALLITPATNQAGSTIISVSVSDGTASTGTTFTLTVNAVNDPPGISDIADQTTTEATPTAAIAFTVADPDTALTSLALSSASSNPSLIPPGNITFGGSAGSRTVTLTPLANQSGTALITVSVNDGTSTNSDTFLLTVNASNRPPTLNPIASLNLTQNASLQTVALNNVTSGGPNENQPLIVAASSSNPALIPHPKVSYTSPATTGSLTFTPAPGQSGTATITVTVNDAQPQNSIVTRTFTVTVNGAPVISIVPNQIVPEDAVAAAIPFTVSDPESAAAALTVSAVSSNTGLLPNSNVAVLGTGANRAVSVTPLHELSGNTFISITASDPNGNSSVSTFLVTVVSVNDAPTLGVLPDITLPVDSSMQTVALAGITSGAANENQVLSVTATSSNPSIIPNPAVTYTSPNTGGTLRFTPAPGASGLTVITVRVLDDGGTSNGGSNSITRTFRVNVTSSDAPLLRMELVGGKPLVSWPAAAGTTWLLQGAPRVGDVPVWRGVPVTPVLAAGRYWVTNAPAGSMKFFRLCAGCPLLYSPPDLSIRQLAGNDFRVAWPTNFGDFILESRTHAASGTWNVIPGSPVIISGTNNVFLTITQPEGFFRLRGP